MSGRDANDTLRSDGPDALRTALDDSVFDPSSMLDPDRDLKIGSEAEVARRVIEDLRERYGEITYSEGELWFWNRAHWEALTETMLLPFIRKYDGKEYRQSEASTPKVFRVNDRTRVGVQKLIAIEMRQDNFFADNAPGINVRNGFIQFENDVPHLVPHAPDQRTRHVLNTEWHGDVMQMPPAGSLLRTFLDGSFLGDPDTIDKINSLSEMAACAILGMGTRLTNPKAFILYGPSANNGKSVFIALLKAMMDERATASLTAQQLGDERMRATLPGVLLNAANELGSAAIRSDTFKSTITGEPTNARQVYKVPISFSPVAQHVYATNTLPPFSDGMDAGILRRLHIIPFNRTIPEHERIQRLADQIIAQESTLLLSWIISGALRLLKQGQFSSVPSGSEVLAEWISISDPVIAWLDDEEFVEVTGNPKDRVHVRLAFKAFEHWARDVGLPSNRNLVWQRTFTERLKHLDYTAVGIRRTREGNVVCGIRLRRPGQKCDSHMPEGDA